ncbi:MAG: PQQ-binding-like beta-propeller repeat protein [Arcicella sp.]|nr:PQQ-binding-like beta-propeller repeat protein [Arcicella sp.]
MKNLTKILVSIYVAIMMIAVACKKDEPTPTTPVTPTTTTPVVTKSTAKDITKFSFAALSPVVDATIDATAKTITATVPAATDLTKLIPTITLSDKATVSPATGVAQDFSKEVSYTVTAEDASTVVWKVNVVKAVVSIISIPDPKPINNNSPDGIYYGGSQRLGVLDINTGKTKWDILTSNAFSIPAISEGMVYATYGGKIGEYSAIDGTLKWEKVIVDRNQGCSNPIIENGVLVVATTGYFASGNAAAAIPAKIIGLDPLTGNQLWEYKQAQNKNGSGFVLPMTASNGNIYVVQDRKTLAVEAKTGKLLWEIGGDYYISDYNGFLLGRYNVTPGGALSNSNAIYKFDKSTGLPSILVPNNTSINRTPYVVSSGIIYFADYNSSTAKIYAIDANTGASKWTITAPSAKAVSWNNTPIAYNGLVYFSGDDKTIYAYDSQTGAKKWEAKTEGDNRVLVVANDILYSANNAISAQNSQIKWTKTGNDIDPLIFSFKLIRDKKMYEPQKSINDK